MDLQQVHETTPVFSPIGSASIPPLVGPVVRVGRRDQYWDRRPKPGLTMGRKASLSVEVQFLAESRTHRGDRHGAARENGKYTPHARRATKPDTVRHYVVDNLLPAIPVLQCELDVIDIYLGALLDQMLDLK
jgi:hypothetical protein